MRIIKQILNYLALLTCILLQMEGVSAQITTIVGGDLLNGNFNTNSYIGPPPVPAVLYFSETPSWENIGTGDQLDDATGYPFLGFDDSRYALIDDDDVRVFGLDTGYTMLEGDSFNLSYSWQDSTNWEDSLDQIGVTLFTTSDGSISGTRNNLVTSLSGLSAVNDFSQSFSLNGFYTAGALAAGKNLFVQINGVDGGDGSAGVGISFLDNFVLSVGVSDVPPGPKAPSPLTGVNLFSDTFNRPNTTGLSLDASTAGMSSAVFTPVVDTTYAEFTNTGNVPPEATIGNNKMQLAVGPGQSYAGIDHNFIDAPILTDGGFAIETIVDPKTGSNGDASDRYAAIGVGLSQANATIRTTGTGPDANNSDPDVQIIEQAALAFVIYDDGKFNFFDSFALTDTGDKDISGAAEYENASVDGKQSFLSQVGQVIDDEYKVRLEFEVVDFNEGSSVTLTAFIQDIQIDLDTSNGIEANPVDRDSYTFTWDGLNQNYIAFEGRAQTTTTFESLMIETLGDSTPGDFDGDGDVDGHDFLVWQRGDSPMPLSSDDLEAWQLGYGNPPLSETIANATAVPEPCCAILLTALLSLVASSCRFTTRKVVSC